MLLVIGNHNCPRCKMTKAVLNNKDIEYEYKLNDEISKEELDIYLEKAKTKGLMYFPLIIKDEEIIKLEEIVK